MQKMHFINNNKFFVLCRKTWVLMAADMVHKLLLTTEEFSCFGSLIQGAMPMETIIAATAKGAPGKLKGAFSLVKKIEQVCHNKIGTPEITLSSVFYFE
jgi:hypothetical protein